MEKVAPSELERIAEWRVKCLLDAGYDAESAVLIGLDTSIDLHLAIELLKRGCPREAALRILF
jgi:hypothetical protein